LVREPFCFFTPGQALWKCRAVEKSEDPSDFPPALENPAKDAGFSHSHRAGYGDPTRTPFKTN
jgi:hypothetical protein